MDVETLTTGADGPYWQGLAQGELRLPRCANCGAWHWPAVFRCASCGGWEMEWPVIEPRGTVYSWTRTWHEFPGLEGLAPPFISATVEIANAGGLRLMGLFTDADISIGLPVSGVFATTRCFEADIPALHWSSAGGRV